MKTIIAILALASAASAQSTNAIYEDWAAGNRTLSGGSSYVSCPSTTGNITTNTKWGPLCGGTSGIYPWQTLTFPTTGLTVDHSRPGSEAAISLTNIISGPGGTVQMTAPNNDYMASALGALNSVPIQVSGVTTCGGGGNCGANGKMFASPIDYFFTTGMTGTTATVASHQLVNGDTVWLQNCVGNSTYYNAPSNVYGAKFTVANVTSTTFDLTGFTGTACASSAYVRDNSRFYGLSTTFSGTYGSQSGTVIRAATGFDILGNVTTHATHPTDWVAGNLVPGQTWNANFNRVRFSVTCDYPIDFPHPASGNGYNLGTYNRAQSCSAVQGVHYYLTFAGNQYANHTMYFEGMRTPAHSTSMGFIDSSQFPEDGTYIGNYCGTPVHFWDGLTEFYINYGPYVTSNIPAAGGTCRIGQMSFALVTGEQDTQVNTVQATYTGTQYEVTWLQPGYMPGQTFEVTYSTSGSLHANGWSSGATPVTVTGPTGTAASDVTPWLSPTMSEQPNIWVGIRARVKILAATGADGGGASVITPYNGTDMQTGDTVATVSVPGVTDGTYTVTRIPATRFQFSDGTATNMVVSGSGGSQVGTVTTASPHGMRKGRVIQIAQTSSGLLYELTKTVITSVPDSTHFVFSYAGGQLGSFGGAPSNGTLDSVTDPLAAIIAFPAISLDGTTSGGTATSTVNSPAGGTATPTSNTTGFYEMLIPSQAASVSPSSLASGTVSTSYSQTLTASNFASTVTWSLLSGTLPTGITFNTTTHVLAGTPTTTSGSPFTFTIRATDGTSTVDTPYSVTIGAAPGTAPTITTASLAAGTVGTAYSQTLTATGDTPITWTVSTGAIPAWAALNASTGALTGTPNAAAVTSFTVTATNATSPPDTKALSITITAASVSRGSKASSVRFSGVRQ